MKRITAIRLWLKWDGLNAKFEDAGDYNMARECMFHKVRIVNMYNLD